MTQPADSDRELVSLAEAQRICRERLGMSGAQFRHELAEHVRGRGGIPWVAAGDAVGVYRTALDALVSGRTAEGPLPEQETTDE